MPGIEFLGWLASAYIGSLALPAAELDKYNDAFAYSVDHNQSCWTRVGGTHGTYGSPEDYTLDPVCNYRLRQVSKEGTYEVWQWSRG